MKNGALLAVLVARAAAALVPTTASALCDPHGPRGGFVDGIPAGDNPVWCEMSQGSTALPRQGVHGYGYGYGYGYGVAPATHHRNSPRLRR